MERVEVERIERVENYWLHILQSISHSHKILQLHRSYYRFDHHNHKQGHIA
jgi:hypothetical protein